VLDQNGYPVVGKEIQVRLQLEDLDGTSKSSEGNAQAQTNVDGRFSVEKSRIAEGMLIIPRALLVDPFSDLIAIVTPWEYLDVQEFFSSAYLIGSYCLPHPVEINMSVGSLTNAVTFSQLEIKDRLYRGERPYAWKILHSSVQPWRTEGLAESDAEARMPMHTILIATISNSFVFSTVS
jgi:hypothetical protein